MLATNNLSTILLELLITKSVGNKGLKINTKNARLICSIYSTLIAKTAEQRQLTRLFWHMTQIEST